MNELSVFKSPKGAARFFEAYDAILKHWPEPYEELDISTRFGTTHIIASGDPNAKPIILLSCMAGTAMAWLLNVDSLSKHFRVYVVEIY